MPRPIKSEAIFHLVCASSILMASHIAYEIRFQTIVLPSKYLIIALALTLLSLCLLSMNGFYEKTRMQGRLKLIRESIKLTISAGTLVALLLFLTKSGADFSRIWMTYTIVFASLFIALARGILNIVSKTAYNTKNILLLGSRAHFQHINSSLGNHNDNNLSIRKHFEKIGNSSGRSIDPVLSYIETNRNTEGAIAEVWITADIYSTISHLELEATFSNSSVRLVYIPLVPELNFDYEIEKIDGILTINSGLSGSNRARTVFKWLEDITLSTIGLILLSPFFLMIALAIKIDSKGPVFYKQQRYGINGREIRVWKFRTMSVSENSEEFKQATKNDPRITRVGRFLRKSSLDEIPQLFNVLGGSMSLVGPRPHPNQLNEEYRSKVDHYMQRHSVKPGITGLAQANGARGETDTIEKMERRISYDLEYIRDWSIMLDIKIIAKTFSQVINQAFK